MDQPQPDSLYDFVMAELADAKGRWPEVAAGSGVALSTLKKIARRDVLDPGVSYVERLAKYFREQRVA